MLNAKHLKRVSNMSTFNDWHNSFEKKFAHNAEMQFKADTRRNELLGLWAAELMSAS